MFIRTFGFFDVFIDGKPLAFRSSKAKELLALLVDRNGGIVTTEEALSYIWEDKEHSDANFSLCRSAFSKLMKTLEEAGIRNLVKVDGRGKMIDKTACDCDYFKMLDGDKKYIDSFADAYMIKYSWAEETAGLLYSIKHKND